MSGHTDHQIIRQGKKPVFVIVPYDEYLDLIKKKAEEKVYFPHEIVELNVMQGKSLVRSWREYKKLSQAQVASRIGVTQGAYCQMEKPNARLRKISLEKIATALDVDVAQLTG